MLHPVDSVSVTILADNVVDGLLPNHGPAKRPFKDGGAPRYRATRFLHGGEVIDSLQAQHGFSALVATKSDADRQTILFDAGFTPDGVVENMHRLRLLPDAIEAIVLSHGHPDHTTGLDGLTSRLGPGPIPLLVHPKIWTRRRIGRRGMPPVEIRPLVRTIVEEGPYAIVEQTSASVFGRNMLLTGEVPRLTEFEVGFPGHESLSSGGWEPDPLIIDDQSLVVHVRGKGLVVLTGCGHAGVINILRFARELTGVAKICAVLGGFHLNGSDFDWSIPAVCEGLQEIGPDYIIPSHCTGWKACMALAQTFPTAYIPNSVGTRYEF